MLGQNITAYLLVNLSCNHLDRYWLNRQKNIISKESLKTYFSQQNTLKSFSLPEAMESYVGYRDSADGLLILPKEYDDESE